MQKKFLRSFGADSLDSGSNLDNLGINPEVRTTVLNYTVIYSHDGQNHIFLTTGTTINPKKFISTELPGTNQNVTGNKV